tara:strand:- start:2206 stop:2496 length:291 start_codon:yes stop_codon:yes gene_type:complete
MKKKKVKTPVDNWTTTEKIQKCLVIKKKITDFQFGTVFPTIMKDLDDIVNSYIREDVEYTGSIKLPETQRILAIKLRNSKKWPPEIVIKHNAGRLG